MKDKAWHFGGVFLICMIAGGTLGVAQSAPLVWIFFSTLIAAGMAFGD